ncbi:MAG: TRAP transporter substrate-binding protein DctP [Hyphomicrobiaceae bacterium]
MLREALRCGLLAGAVLAGSGPPAEAQSKIVWDIAIYGPPREITVPIETVAKYIDEKSGGNFTFKLHYSESIAPAKSVLDSLKIEAIQGGLVTFGYTPGKVPLHLAIDLPYLPIATLEQLQKVQEAFNAWEPARQEMAKWNGISLYGVLLPVYEFMGTGKPPRTLEDWKGMRVRVLGTAGEAMKLLGAVPTSVSAPEVYTALERGTFSAVAMPFTYALGAYKIYQVSKWYTVGMKLGAVNNAWVFSKSAYEKLPAEYKKLLEDVKAAQYAAGAAALRAADEKYVPLFDQAGLERVTITPELAAALQAKAGQPIWESWVKQNEAKGLPAREALDLILKTAKGG